VADGSFEKKLEAVKEASKSATLQRKLDKAKEVSNKSATLQKKLKEAKASKAASPAEAQPVTASSASSATVSKTAILQKKLDEARRSVLLKSAAEEVSEKATPVDEDVEKEALEERTSKMKPGDEGQGAIKAIKATSSKRPSSPDKQDNMEARVADLMERQEAAKSRRRGVVEKAKSVNREEVSSTSRREKRAAGDMEEAPEEARTPKKKRDKTKSPEVRRASPLLKGANKMTEGSAPQKQAVEFESTDDWKDAPARERGARPKAWSKPAAQDGAFLDTGAEERPFNVFRTKVDVSDDFADSGRPKTQPQSKPSDFKEKEREESDSSPSEPSRWRAHSEDSEQDDHDDPELRDWRWLQQPAQETTRRGASEEEMAADVTNQALKDKKKRRRKAKGAASSATKSVQSTAQPALRSASKKDRPKRKKTKAHVEKEETTPPKGKRIASPEGTTPKRDRSDFSVQQELGQETSSQVRGAEDVMSVSSGSDNTDYGVMDCRFITENDAALGLRRRIQRHKTRALEEAKNDEKKARKKAKKAAKRALKAKRKADSAEAAAGCRKEDDDPMWAKLMELSQQG